MQHSTQYYNMPYCSVVHSIITCYILHHIVTYYIIHTIVRKVVFYPMFIHKTLTKFEAVHQTSKHPLILYQSENSTFASLSLPQRKSRSKLPSRARGDIMTQIQMTAAARCRP